ncbi:MAG TPA: MaoC family dehydratase [Jatrophihabitans sp.]|nr:MaoC family dehydratase [Jatrophihabitans sp.]
MSAPEQPGDDLPGGTARPTGYVPVGPNRLREVVGFCYEDLPVGVVIEHRPGRTITEMDNVLMSMLSMNDSPLHIDAAFSEQGTWGKPLVSSLVTLSIVAGMAARSTSGKAIANLGWERIVLPAPVFVGDTLYAESEITGKRLSESRPGQGIAHCRTTGRKSTGEVVLSFDRSFLVPTRAHDTHRAAGY